MTLFPPRPQPYTAPTDGCVTCGTNNTVLMTVAGRHCVVHPPEFDPTEAVHRMTAGWPGAALAYVRTYAEEES